MQSHSFGGAILHLGINTRAGWFAAHGGGALTFLLKSTLSLLRLVAFRTYSGPST